MKVIITVKLVGNHYCVSLKRETGNVSRVIKTFNATVGDAYIAAIEYGKKFASDLGLEFQN
jgi:hypothetical protein